jgi:hypothetical protein
VRKLAKAAYETAVMLSGGKAPLLFEQDEQAGIAFPFLVPFQRGHFNFGRQGHFYFGLTVSISSLTTSSLRHRIPNNSIQKRRRGRVGFKAIFREPDRHDLQTMMVRIRQKRRNRMDLRVVK